MTKLPSDGAALALGWLHPELGPEALEALALEALAEAPQQGNMAPGMVRAPRLQAIENPSKFASAASAAQQGTAQSRASAPVPVFIRGAQWPGSFDSGRSPDWRLALAPSGPREWHLAQRQWIARIWPHKLPRFDLLCHYAEAGYSLAELSGAAYSGREPSTVGPRGGVQSGGVHGDLGIRAARQSEAVSSGAPARRNEPAGPSRSAPQVPQLPGTNQPRSAPRLLAICGIDGAGKSSHLAALAEHLTNRGLRVGRFKLFRHGLFHATVTDLARRTRGGRRLCLWRTERLIKVYDSLKYFASTVEPELANYDVVLFDRYSYTHEAAALGRLWHLAGLEPLLERFPQPDQVWLLDLPAERAVERLGERGERTIDEHLFMLDRFRRRLLVAAEREGFSVLDARLDFAVNQARLRAECEALLFGAQP